MGGSLSPRPRSAHVAVKLTEPPQSDGRRSRCHRFALFNIVLRLGGMSPTPESAIPSDASPRLVNGVFKGGGAKGIAYAGALRALHERGLWFGSVAGASAGAITASLIASGMDLESLEEAVPTALEAVDSHWFGRIGKAVVGHATSRYESRGLREWLDQKLAHQIGKVGSEPVTFDELYLAKGIELYVIAMDLATGLPVLFCRRTTPGVEVAGAVTSSSAIPAGFPAGRGVFWSPDDGAVVHQLVDGGTWANYPSFVFEDDSFRTWVRGESQDQARWSEIDDQVWAAEERRPTVGFILGDPEPLEHRQPIGLVPVKGDINRRFDQGPTYTSPSRPTYVFGALLSSDWFRLIIAVALAVWVSLSVVVLPIGFRRFSAWLFDLAPDWLYPSLLVGMMSVVVLAVVVTVVLVTSLILLGRLLADTLVPTFTSLLGVPTEVAPWVGLGNSSVVLRVPHAGLSTTGFGVDSTTRRTAVAEAHRQVSQQLDDVVISGRLEALFDDVDPEPSIYSPGRRSPEMLKPPDRIRALGLTSTILATALAGGLGWFATNLAGTHAISAIMLSILAGLFVGGAALWYLSGRAGIRAAARAQHGVTVADRRFGTTAQLIAAAGAALVVLGAVLSGLAMSDRADDTVTARVTQAQSQEGSNVNTYTVRPETTVKGSDDSIVRDVLVASDRHLRLGERVFISIDPEDPEAAKLAQTLDDVRFPIAVILSILGFGVITSGVRRQRWEARNRNLNDLVGSWHGRSK